MFSHHSAQMCRLPSGGRYMAHTRAVACPSSDATSRGLETTPPALSDCEGTRGPTGGSKLPPVFLEPISRHDAMPSTRSRRQDCPSVLPILHLPMALFLRGHSREAPSGNSVSKLHQPGEHSRTALYQARRASVMERTLHPNGI